MHGELQESDSVTQGVDVEAETLYEAAGLGLARLKKDGWIEGLGPGSRLEIQVREPSTGQSLTVQPGVDRGGARTLTLAICVRSMDVMV